jgi:hypothetical protein
MCAARASQCREKQFAAMQFLAVGTPDGAQLKCVSEEFFSLMLELGSRGVRSAVVLCKWIE